MSLSTATITFDLADLTGTDFDSRRVKVWATTNVEGDTVIDTVGNAIRLGSGNATVNSDGTGSLTVWVPGTGSNPDSWQTSIHVSYPDRNATGGRSTRVFGPFTITASANLADLVEEQEVPPEYVTTVTTLLDGYVTEGAELLAQQEAISGLTGEDDAVALLVNTPASDTAAALAATFVSQSLGGHYYFEKFVNGPVDTTGATDYSTELAAAHTAIAAFGGGTLEFPAGMLKFLDRHLMPNDGASAYPRQQAIRWIGQGSYSDPKGGSGPFPALAGSGGTILDFRYAGRLDSATVTSGSATVLDASITADDAGLPVYGTGIPAGTFIGPAPVAGTSFKLSSNPRTQTDVTATSSGTSVRVGLPKIDTRGKGTWEMTGLTITDQGTSSNPFIRTTNTTLHLHHMAISGNPSKSGATCDQDAIILGGTNAPAAGDGDNKPNGPFQGYGTVIENVHFDRIRRAVLMQLYCNSSVFRNNNIWITCGTNLTNGAAIELASSWGGGGNYVFGNVIAENLIECSNYVYPIKLDYAQFNSIIANSFYDANAAVTLAHVRFMSNQAKNNTVIGGYGASAIPLASEASAGYNTWRPFDPSQRGQEVVMPVYLAGVKVAGRNSAVPEFVFGTDSQTYTAVPSFWTGNNRPPTTGTGYAAAKRGAIYVQTNGYGGTTLYVKEFDGSGLGIVALGPRAKIPTRTSTSASVPIDSGLDDRVVILNNAACTATLPDAVNDGGAGGSNAGKRYTIKNINAASATLATTSGQTIDGASTKTLAQWEKVTVMSDGANWLIIG